MKRSVMKNIYKSLLVFLLIGAVACTSDFDEINKQPGAITTDEASAKYFLTNVQFVLYGPDRFPYWRGPLIHGDRFAGYFTFGFSGSWWNDGLGYTYNGGYTDATYDWLDGYLGGLDNFLEITAVGGEFENERMNAVGKILKGLYFTKFTDVFGELPYSEAGDPDILTPKFDTQMEIYQGVLAELDEAIATIGSETSTGAGVQDMAENDLIFDGDLQKWKKLANTLKLKIGIRALGAPGATFAETAINEALAGELMETTGEDALLIKDEVISQWTSASYGDVWHNFGGLGSKWHMGEVLINELRDNNDPRLSVFAKPAQGGSMTLRKPVNADEIKAFDLMKETLDDAGVVYNTSETADEVTISFAADQYYVGQPTRLNGIAQDYAAWEMFSTPADEIINPKNGGPITPEIILTSADAYFLRATAAVKGVSSEDANAMYQAGINSSMERWGVGSGEITDYLANSPMGTLSGTADEMLEMINTQRWIANYTNGFEGWSIVRKSGYPAALAGGVSDTDIFSMGEINGAYPTRMRYGNSARSTNGTNLDEAIGRQGPDAMDTKLWWAKD